MVALLLSAASCGRPSDLMESTVPDALTPATEQLVVRKEFVILRELTKQYSLQTEMGNTSRLETVTRHLQEHLTVLPDEGRNEEECTIFRQAHQAAY